MSSIYIRSAAVTAALALTACAHTVQSGPSVAQSYAGGRAGQPGGFVALPSPQAATAWNDPSLGGRSAQPSSWIESRPAPAQNAAAYCYLGGRDAQPFSGPNLRMESSAQTPLCVRDHDSTRL